MKRLIPLIIAALVILSCKGRNQGPLVKDSFDTPAEEAPVMQGQKSTGPARPDKITESISPCEGCIILADLMAGMKEYKGKKISVTGRVVKFNAGIMDKNWVHIQDGTEAEGAYDLTVTTLDNVSVGDIVTFTGVISLDKDFGYGYRYEIIMEDAVLSAKPASEGSL